jgi:hypothetical protein
LGIGEALSEAETLSAGSWGTGLVYVFSERLYQEPFCVRLAVSRLQRLGRWRRQPDRLASVF